MNGQQNMMLKLTRLITRKTVLITGIKSPLYKTDKKDGNYRYRLGLQMYPIANGEYTIARETYFNE